MIVIEIAPNANCEAAELRLFHDVEAPRQVTRVCLQDAGQPPRWYAVTGWTRAAAPCPALAQRVDDSGEGLAVLIHGGDAGLRLRPVGSPARWGDDPAERGAPFLLLADDGQSVGDERVHHG